MTNQSILSVFGLLFGSQLRQMQQETFTAALITNLNSLALNFSGLFIGPAIKSFKPRNVAASGCILVSFGLTLCAFATEGWHFIIGYSIFVSPLLHYYVKKFLYLVSEHCTILGWTGLRLNSTLDIYGD